VLPRPRENPVAYTIEFAPAVESHLNALSARDRRLVFDGIKNQFSRQPAVETRNRKPMRPNPLAPWELRLGDLRVYYRVQESPAKRVQVAAVGIKRRQQVWIGGKRADL
jgi:mRNA-degrading endonuclease RelE of RelBE toxin-antitoxin system